MKKVIAVVAVLVAQIFAVQSGHCALVDNVKSGHYDLNPCDNKSLD